MRIPKQFESSTLIALADIGKVELKTIAEWFFCFMKDILYVLQILIEDSDFPDRPYLFPCGEWIPADDEQDETQIIRDLYPIRDSSTLKATRKMGE